LRIFAERASERQKGLENPWFSTCQGGSKTNDT
jgi:hypothetical protein